MKQQRGLLHAVFACISLVVWSGPLRSQEATGAHSAAALADHGEHSADADSEDHTGPDDERAAAAYKESLTRYTAGDLGGALQSMRESYRLSGRQELLYNLARLEAELNDCPSALADYQKYLVAVPEGQYRLEAANAGQQLQARCGTAQVAASPPAKPAIDVVKPPEPAPAPPPTSTTKSKPAGHEVDQGYFTPTRWVGWSLIATSALAGAGALYVRALAVKARDAFQDSANRQLAGGPLADHGLERDQHRKERWAVALGVTGGALLAGGITVLLLEPQKGQTAGRVSLNLAPGGLEASFVHGF